MIEALAPRIQGPTVYTADGHLQVNLGQTPPLTPPNTNSFAATDVLATQNGTDVVDLRYNPRNLTRDFQYDAQSIHMQFSDEEHLLSCENFTCFYKRIDGWEAGDPNIYGLANSLHPQGHFTMGGLQNDPFVSPGDPSFYFHHAQIDRMWAIWQAQDPKNRQYATGGTRDPFNRKLFPLNLMHCRWRNLWGSAFPFATRQRFESAAQVQNLFSVHHHHHHPYY